MGKVLCSMLASSSEGVRRTDSLPLWVVVAIGEVCQTLEIDKI